MTEEGIAILNTNLAHDKSWRIIACKMCRWWFKNKVDLKKYLEKIHFFHFFMHFTCKYNTLKWPNIIYLSFNYTGPLKCRPLAVLKWSSSKGLDHMCLQMNCLWKSWITLFATKCLFSSMYTNMLLCIATYYKSGSTILAGIWFSFNMIFFKDT